MDYSIALKITLIRILSDNKKRCKEDLAAPKKLVLSLLTSGSRSVQKNPVFPLVQ